MKTVYPRLYRGSDFYYEVDRKTGAKNLLFSLATVMTVLGSTPRVIQATHTVQGKVGIFAVRDISDRKNTLQ